MSFTKAYESSLRQHHSFVIRPVFSVSSGLDVVQKGKRIVRLTCDTPLGHSLR